MKQTITLREPQLPSADELRDRFVYDPQTGVLRFRESGKGRPSKKGGVAGSIKGGTEYLVVLLGTRRVPVHRVVWCMHYGSWPDQLVDHINGNPADNRIANLRAADKKLNAENQRWARSDNSLGILGARKHGKKFRAQIRSGGVTRYLGLFETAEAAHAAYVVAKRGLHAGCSI